jgi:EmrB/QacA subfamily drug resistance transporter
VKNRAVAASAQPAAVGLTSPRGPVLGALMLSTALVAIDSTIIATAVPSIVHDVGGFTQFPWLFSIYLLTQAVTVPLYGRFADVAGRKPVLFLGIGLFLLGSVLCGLAWSMPILILARAVQGLGAGAVQPMSMTVLGDLYTVAERARVQGYLASVWAASAVIGPTLGGVFSEYLSWRWIFFVNLPIGLLAVWMLRRHFHEKIVRHPHTIDYAGATALVVGCSLLILALLEGGVSWAWASVPGLVVAAGAALLLVAFVVVERRSAEPVLPLWVFTRRVLLGGNLVAAAVGVILIGLSSYVPTYVQAVLGTGALVAGFAVAALSVGWPIAAALAGRVYLRIGFRDTALIGAGVVVIGAAGCAALTARSAVWQVAAACFVVGVGLGLCSSPTVVAVQSVVGWDRRGVVTGTNMFSRSLGSAVGAAVFGALANAAIAHRLAHAPAALAGRLPSTVDAAGSLSAPAGAGAQELAFVRSALFAGAHQVFLGLLVIAVLSIGAVLLMPRQTRELTFPPADPPADSPADRPADRPSTR